MSFKSPHLNGSSVVASRCVICSIKASHIHLVPAIHHDEHLQSDPAYLVLPPILRDAPEHRRGKRLAIFAEFTAWPALENYLVVIRDGLEYSHEVLLGLCYLSLYPLF